MCLYVSSVLAVHHREVFMGLISSRELVRSDYVCCVSAAFTSSSFGLCTPLELCVVARRAKTKMNWATRSCLPFPRSTNISSCSPTPPGVLPTLALSPLAAGPQSPPAALSRRVVVALSTTTTVHTTPQHHLSTSLALSVKKRRRQPPSFARYARTSLHASSRHANTCE